MHRSDPKKPINANTLNEALQHETVARALTVLRLTRWLSLVRRHCRDRRTGRLLGNLYVLHDEPLTPYEAIELDPDYLALVGQALSHASQSVRRVGSQVLREIDEDPMLAGRALPNRLHVLMQRMRARPEMNGMRLIHRRSAVTIPKKGAAIPKKDCTEVFRTKEVRTVPRA